MKSVLVSLFSTIIVILTLISTTSSAAGYKSQHNTDAHIKSYFVAFNSNVDTNIVKAHGGEIKKQYKYMPLIVAKLSGAAAQALSNNPNIEYIEEDGMVQAIGQETPWGVIDVNGTDAHQFGVTGAGINIGVIDTGIDYSHEDLQVSGGVTFVEGTSNYMDDNGHGTHVAGTIAAVNNIAGVIGVSPQVNLYAIKVLDQYRNGNYSDVVAGIEWSISNHMDIVNMSIGGSTASRTLQKAIDHAYNSGILLIAAAGNSGYDKRGTILYPARYNSVIAVGAVDQQNNRATFSSVGKELELMAPGMNILSTIPGGYGYDSGTSMAAPHVTGVAALVWEVNPELSNFQIRKVLNESATMLGDSFYYGNGLVNAFEAVNNVKPALTVK